MSNNRFTSLSMSTIDISFARESGKIETIKVGTKGRETLRDIQTTLRAGGTHREKFDPPWIVESGDHIFVSVGFSSWLWMRRNVVVDIDLRDMECIREHQGIKSYRKTTEHVEVVVAGSPPVLQARGSGSQTPDSVPPAAEKLVPTTDELIRECAKFRVLVIGNSGVGKSTLIHKMFGVKVVHASDTVRGKADINQEFTAETNERFVVHDSLGFEAADAGNMDIVKKFVKRRQEMPRLEDQLHAIWLCMEIPHSGGRFLETGVEKFLQHRSKIIGNIPLIIVLTKMDLLDARLEIEAQDMEPLESHRSAFLEKHCIAPLRNVAGPEVVSVAVSAMGGYYVPISNLLEATKEDMAKHDIHEAPRAMASIAQRVDMKAKIETSIAIGKKKYWQNLLKSAFFHGRTLRECLEVICKDIVTVWNLNGLDQCLMDDQLIEKLLPPDVLRAAGTSQPSMGSLWRNMAEEGFISAAAEKVKSVVADMLHMPYDRYQETVRGAEIFMSYIVNLICVMQAIFLLAPDNIVKHDTVNRAIEECKDKRGQLNSTIKYFAKKQALRFVGQDQVLKETESLIRRYTMSDYEVEILRQGVVSRSSTM